jgi:hypothetical protein
MLGAEREIAKRSQFSDPAARDHSIGRIRKCPRFSMASRVHGFSAFLSPCGAPDPGDPPCIRQRYFLLISRDTQGLATNNLSEILDNNILPH